MPEGIGYDIAGAPEEDANVASWKDWLKRPENLSTALVLAAAVTSERRQGQGKLNKALESGVGALGFRGGLQQGVQAQRRQQDIDAQSAAESAADIAAQQAATSQGAERNRIAGQQVDVAQQGVNVQRDQLTTPRPLAPSEAEQNTALAGYYRSLAGAQNIESGAGLNPVQRAIRAEMARVADIPGEEPNLQRAIQFALQEDFLSKLFMEGKVRPDGTIAYSPEDIEMAKSLNIPIPEVPAPTGGGTSQPTGDQNSFRRSGRPFHQLILGPESEAVQAIAEMKKDPSFKELDDTTILDKVEEARSLAADRAQLAQSSVEQLEDLLGAYRRVLAPEEIRNLQKEIRKKKGLPEPATFRPGGPGAIP